MSDASPATATPAAAPQAAPRANPKKRSWLRWGIIVPLVLLIIGGGAAAYLLMFAKPPPTGAPAKAEAPMPSYLEIKPFVVSLRGADDSPHFVQLGISLMLTGRDLGALITADEPEVDDAIRLSALQFKVEDIENPAGVDKMRKAILANLNTVLLKRIGAERVANLGGGSKDAVKTLYFTQLVVE